MDELSVRPVEESESTMPRPSAPLTWRKVRVPTLVVYATIHLACLAAFYLPFNRQILSLFVACYLVRAFGLTVAYHRYFAHRAFKTSRAFQLVLAVIGSLNMQGGLIWWAETHRYHHGNADSPSDLHSPTYHGLLYSHFGWFLNKDNARNRLERIRDLSRFPELVWLNRYHFLPAAVFAAGAAWFFGAAGLVWGVCIPIVLLWQMTHWVQSLSHAWGGYRRWPLTPDFSRNHWLLGVVTLGEFHNNHHAFAASSKQGHAWWELDLGYLTLKLLAAMKLVSELRLPHVKGKAHDLEH